MDQTSLLLNLEEHDFNQVLIELRAAEENTVFHYVIDVYELEEYCYPFGINPGDRSNRIKKTIDYISDEQYAYYQLFNIKKERVILFDEYVVELIQFKRYIDFAIQNNIELVSALKKYEDFFSEEGFLDPKTTDDFEEIINTKLANVLSYSIGLLHDGIDKLIDLFKRQRIIIDEDDFSMSNDDMIIKSIIEQVSDNQKNSPLFDNILSISHVGNDAYHANSKSQSRQIARDRDAKVIERVILINNSLEEVYRRGPSSEKRHVLLYLSSTETSKRIFESEYLLKIINTQEFPINPLRNTAQLFLKALCNSGKFDEAEKNILYLKEKILEIKEFKNRIPDVIVQMEVNRILNERFNYDRESFENYAILNQFAKIEDLIDSVVKKVKREKMSFATHLLPLLHEIIEVGSKVKSSAMNTLISLDNWEYQIKFDYYINKTINFSTAETGLKLQFVSGVDPIRGMVQHLPLIYFNDDSLFKIVISTISEFLMHPLTQSSADNLKSLTLNVYKQTLNARPSLEEKLLKAFLFLMIPSSDGEDTNYLAFNWARSIFEKGISIHPDRKLLSVIETDYVYFIGWAARRCGDYTSSIRFLRQGAQRFPDDPRFYHGLSLSYYSTYQAGSASLSKIENIEKLNKCIEYAEISLRIYEHFEQIDIIIKTRAALYNDLAFFHSELFSVTGELNEFHVIAGRKFMNELKIADPEYKSFPEYLHTESYLELQEYKFIYSKITEIDDGNPLLKDAILKLQFAKLAISGALEIHNYLYRKVSEDYMSLYQIIVSEEIRLKNL